VARAEAVTVQEVFDRVKSALADRYRIESELGSGGMATVYLAHDLKHDRQVALKVLRPELAAVLGRERFFREITITAKLEHPHILTLIDSGEADGLFYYVMPYVTGESLREKLRREKQLAIDEALEITEAMASALEYAHQHGVIHRDIKPENILLHESEAMVADFGIALALKAAAGDRLTETGLSLGTPEYMSPEQGTGEQQLDARSDIYSLAAVLYEMLAGEPPHSGATSQSVIAKLLTEKPTQLRVVRDTVPEHIDAAVMKALAKVPADRFLSARFFVDALSKPGLLGADASAPTRLRSPLAPRGASRVLMESELSRLIGYSRLSMKSDISYVCFRSTDEIVNAINEIAGKIPRDSDEVFYVNQGAGEICVICEPDREELLDRVRDQAVDYRPGVAILRIREAQEHGGTPSVDVPGVYAYFINQLAESGINILDLISTRSQLTVIVAEEDVTRAFSVLNEQIKQHREGIVKDTRNGGEVRYE
jgi:serine/threonine protein kinase